jgi:nitrogen fixation protein FixH
MNAAKLWPLAIISVLGITVAANAVLLYEAGGRHEAAIEPDYYHKAITWDSTLAQRAHDAALGWRLTADLGPRDPRGTPLAVRLTDARGGPLAGARIAVEAVPNAEGAHRLRATLAESPAGGYLALLPLDHRGLWELRFDVARGRERFTATLQREAAAARP